MKRILFLTANPSHQKPLNLMKEFQQLQDAVQATLPADLFVLEWRFAARPEQVPAYLAECQPDIVHFAGHGSRAGGLILEDEEGRDVVVSVDRLGRVLSDLSHRPECVILNACYSAAQARQLLTTVRHVIAMDDAIADEFAIHFSRAFYRALSRQQTIPEAVVTARRAIDLLALPGDQVPIHFQQDDFRDYLLDLERDLRALWDETVAVPLDVNVEVLAALTRPPTATLLADYVREEAVGTVCLDGTRQATSATDVRESGRSLCGSGRTGSGARRTRLWQVRGIAGLDPVSPSPPAGRFLAPLPFFKPLRYWRPDWTPTATDEPLPDLVEWLAQDLARYGLKAEAEQHIRSGRAVLVLDGLDELGVWRSGSPRKSLPKKREDLSPNPVQSGDADCEGGYDPRQLWLRCFDTQVPAATPVALGCRLEVFQGAASALTAPPALTVVQLKPLTQDQIRDYLRDCSELWEAMVEERDLFDVARSPLLLRLLSESYSELQHEPRVRPEQSAGALRYEIFARYVQGTYQREQRKNAGRSLPFTLEEIREGLGRIAMDKVVRGEAQGPTTLSTSDFPGHWALERREAFLALATRLSLLMPERQGTFRMVHGLLQNYLAYQYAVRLAGELQDDAPSPDVHQP